MGIGEKLPRISVKISGSSGGDSTSAKLTTLSIGFGIHQAWIYASMFGANQIFSSSALIDLPGNSYFPFMPATLVFLISILTFSLTLLFSSFSDQKFLRVYVSKKLLAAATVLTSISTFTVFLASTDSSLGWIALWFSGIGTGIGSCYLLLFWGTAFSRHDAGAIVINTALAIIIAVTIYTIILHWLPYPVSGIATSLLPFIELIFLWRLTPLPYSKRHEVPIFNPLPIRRTPFIFRFGLPILIFGYSLGTLRAISMQVILPLTDPNSQVAFWVAACLAMALTLVTLFTINTQHHWDFLFRTLLPIIALAIFTFPFVAQQETPYAGIFLLAGFMCFEALMWIFFGELAQRFRLSPIFVFGLGRGLLALGSCIGSLLVLYVPYSIFFEVFGRAGITVAALLAMVIAYALLPREREIRALLVLKSPDDTAVTDLNAEAEKEGAAPANERGYGFRAQCELIANRYLLSRRETEVLFLLAKGHNAAFIQEKLCVSRSTVKTHMSHIYRKLDIHTQQELLSMLDEVKEELLEESEREGSAAKKPPPIVTKN